MTSKNLSFKLMAEDLKRRVWAIALTVLALIFAQIFPIAVKCSEYAEQAGKWNESTREYMEANILSLLKVNPMAAAVLIGAAVLWAVTSFCYLHNSKKVDFYHSIPVKRHVLYIANYFNGIWVTAAVYLVFTAVTILLAGRCGISGGIHTGRIWMGALINVVFYSLLYTTVSAAMMLTGNIVVALLGTVVFFSYGPAVVGLSMAYMDTWFKTYRETAVISDLFEKLLERTSPFTAYVYALGNFGEGRNVTGAVVTALLVTVVLAVGTYCLYWLRPSEAAGKAMAFAVSQPVIRVLITVVAGLGIGDFFWSLQRSNGWMVFGVVCGSVISHCVIESIYHFDFRKLFSHKEQLAFSTIAALAILFSFRFDVFGYDTYLPSADKVAYASVDIGRLNDWVSYGKVVDDQEIHGQRVLYSYEFTPSEIYMAQHMKSTDVDTILNFAAAGIEENRLCRNEWDQRGTGENAVTYEMAEETAAPAETSDESETARYTTATVTYTLKSGRRVIRNYSINMTKNYELIKKLFQDEEYQKAAYPLLAADADTFVNVRYRQSRSKGDQSLKNLTAQERNEVLSVYRQEFSAMSLEQMEEETPVGLIRFTTETDEKAIAWWNNPDLDTVSSRNYYYGADVRDQDFYPVYPSFTKTIRLLGQYGVSVKDEALSDKIVSVTVSGYAPNSDSYQTVTFTDPEEIKALGDITRNERMLYYDLMYEEDDLTVEVTVSGKTGKAEQEDDMENTYSSFFRKGEVPQIVKDRMGF